MPLGRLAILTTLVIMAQGCASISTEYDFDPGRDFTAYSTYDWMAAESRRVSLRARDPLVEQRIRDAIEEELMAKGLRRSESEDPDFRVGYLLVLEDEVNSQTMYEGSDPDWRYRTYGPATTTTQTQVFATGTLVIDLFDSERRELVWRGAAQGEVKELQDPDKRQARIKDAVSRILAGFPPGG